MTGRAGEVLTVGVKDLNAGAFGEVSKLVMERFWIFRAERIRDYSTALARWADDGGSTP